MSRKRAFLIAIMSGALFAIVFLFTSVYLGIAHREFRVEPKVLGEDSYDDYDDHDKKEKKNEKDSYDNYDEDDYDDYDDYDDHNDNYEKDDHDEYEAKDEYDVSGMMTNESISLKPKSVVEVAQPSHSVDSSGSGLGAKSSDSYGTISVVNEDGTTTKTYKQVSDSGDVEMNTLLYSATGALLEEQNAQIKIKDGQEEIKIKSYDAYGEKISQYQMKSKNGKTVRIKMSEEDGFMTKVKYDVQKEEIVVLDKDSQESVDSLRIQSSGDQFRIVRKGHQVMSVFPLTVDGVTGDVFIGTALGEIQLSAMPDTIIEQSKSSGKMDIVEKAELSDDDGLSYVLTGTKQEKMLGIFTIELPIVLHYDAQSGQLADSKQSYWSKTLDIFSF